MSEPTYTLKEIIDIQFKNQSNELKEIKILLKEQNTNYDKRFSDLDGDIKSLRIDIEALKTDNARYKTVWGIGATLAATVFAFLLNRIF